MTGSNSAWRLVVGEGMQVAVSDYEMIEYVIDPQLHPVPITPTHCSNAMLWREQIIPVMDLPVLFGKSPYANVSVAVAIVAYQMKPRAPLNYLGLLLQQPPARVTVGDDQGCDLPTSDNNLWESMGLALACFDCDDLPTPIINVTHLCSETFRKSVAQRVPPTVSIADKF